MPVPFDNIVQHIFHQPSLQSVTVDELERMTQRHPAFAAAHFLLLRKMQDTGHSRFDNQLQKTALYFNNPLWLQYLLSPDQVEEPAVLNHPPFIESNNEAIPREQPVETALPTIVETEHTPLAEPSSEESATELMDEHEPVIVPDEPDVKGEEPQQPATVEEPISAAEAETAPGTAPLTEATSPVYQSAIEIAEQALVEQPASTAPVQESADEESGDPDATEAVQETQQETPAITDKPLLRTILEVPAAKEDLLFEPFHTVDYFASQGISLSKTEAIEPKDNFGKQLRSFTEWLKTMKRLPQASIDKMLTEKEDSRVTADAVHSLESKEVITEAMAEVFEKQGLAEKAAEVYRKLSLQNPSKSTYFAAKIEALKL